MDDTSDTKLRLIQAACEEFAKMGYSKARVREICYQAKANLASVNYHFGGKANLYIATLDYLFTSTEDQQEWSCKSCTAEDARKELLHVLNHYFDTLQGEQNLHLVKSRIIHREITEPSEMFEEVYRRFLVPRHEVLQKLLTILTGKSQTGLDLAQFGLIGLCSFYTNAYRLVLKYTDDPGFIQRNRDAVVKQIFTLLMIPE